MKIYIIFLFLSFNLLSSNNEVKTIHVLKTSSRMADIKSNITFRNHILPFITFIYTTSTMVSAHRHYTALQNANESKLYHTINLTKDVLKIILALWLANYIRNFTFSKFLKASFMTSISIIKHWAY